MGYAGGNFAITRGGYVLCVTSHTNTCFLLTIFFDDQIWIAACTLNRWIICAYCWLLPSVGRGEIKMQSPRRAGDNMFALVGSIPIAMVCTLIEFVFEMEWSCQKSNSNFLRLVSRYQVYFQGVGGNGGD